jgi:hypothetical protein
MHAGLVGAEGKGKDTAVGDGCRAAVDAQRWFEEQDEKAAGRHRAP